jgi:glyoxylase-like metal-dependent hydrolase (beta-lactamase superfamily II)
MPYTITPLLVGVRNVDQGIMTYQRGYGKRIWLPMWSFLLRGEDRVVLVDTGLDDFVTPPEFTEETGLEPQYMEDALAAHGLAPGDVDALVNTHLHDDHCGNNPLFPGIPNFVQRLEWEFAVNPHPLDYRYDPDLLDGPDVRTVDGDAEVLPGVRVLLTPGHTPGSQSVLVDTGAEKALITGFCCNRGNFSDTGPAACPGVHTDAVAAWDSAQRIAALAREPGIVLLPTHELDLARACA